MNERLASIGERPGAGSTDRAVEGVPSTETLREWNAFMASLGPRHTGNAAHKAFVDFLASEFEALGLTVVRETQSFERWEANSWLLAVVEDGHETPVEVASYYPYSGQTGEHGVVAEVVEAGLGDESALEGLDVAGKIALINQKPDGSLRTALGRLAAMYEQLGVAPPEVSPDGLEWSAYVKHAIDSDPKDVSFARNATAELVFTAPDLGPAMRAGAVGAVVIVSGMSLDKLRGQYAPFMSPLQGLPTLYVDERTGAELREACRSGRSVRLTLTVDLSQGSTDQLHCVLPGESDELVIVDSHTDGPNVFEENGALGVLAIAKALSQVSESERRRSTAFVLATGHFVGAVRSSDFFVEGHPELIEKAVAAVVVEHLGATEWVDDEQGYRPTGEFEQAICMVSDREGLVDEAVDSLRTERVGNVLVATPFAGELYFGEGGAFHRAGIGTVGYIPLPNYLIACGPGDHLDKFDEDRMHAEVRALTRLVRRLDGCSSEELAVHAG